MNFLYIFGILSLSDAENVECEFKCQSDLEYCLSRCGGDSECIGICVRENDNCNKICSVAVLIKK